MNRKMVFLAFVAMFSITSAQNIERTDKDGYFYNQRDETSYWNFHYGNGCPPEEFGLYVATTAIVDALEVRANIAKYKGSRVVIGFQIGTTDNSGNESLKFTPTFKVEIPKAGLIKINKNYGERIRQEALFQSENCMGKPLNRVQYSRLVEAVRIIRANGGRVSYNPTYFYYTFAGGLTMR